MAEADEVLEAQGREGSSVARVVATIVVTFLLYLVVTWLFYLVPGHPPTFPRSPLQFVSPIICLYLGWPAIAGCMGAEVVLLLFAQPLGPAAFWIALGVEFVVNALPYVGWYAIFGRGDHPYPRLERAIELMVVLALLACVSLIWATVVTAFLFEEAQGSSVLDLWTFCFFITFDLASILGTLLLLWLDRSAIVPRAPRFVRARFEQRPRMNLTQRLILVCTLFMTLMVVFSFPPYLAGADLAALTYFDITVMLVSNFLYAGETACLLWIFVCGVLWYLERRFTRPIEVLAHATRRFPEALSDYQAATEEGKDAAHIEEAKRAAEAPVPLEGLEPSGEVADLVADTDTMRASIVSYLDELKAVTSENERVKAELDIASQIQQGAVPHDFAEIDSRLCVQVAASMTPARDVGGDFYDAFMIDSTHLGVIMADVSGKGMPAALFMMRALADLREQMHSHPEDVGLALTRANEALCVNNDAMLFVTAFIGVLDVETGLFSYANAGHNPAWQLGEQGTWLKASKGLVLGIMDMVHYKTETLQLEPGGGLFLYTDGVTEAMNPEDELYSDPRLDRVLAKTEGQDAGKAPSKALVDAVLSDVHHFVNGAPQSDDITALAFRWLPG